MNLDDIINNKLKGHNRKASQTQKRTKLTPEQIHRRNIKKAIRLTKTGDLDLQRKSHAILFGVAVKAGFIDKQTFEILKEL
jgi:hypothetical protein